MSIVDNAKQWEAWSTGEATRIVATAAAATLLGSPQWDALLAEVGVEPLPPDTRKQHASAGPPRSAGPSPIEVRWALQSLGDRVGAAAAELQAAADAHDGYDEAAETAIDKLKRAADRIVDDHLAKYISAVRPKVTTSSIFANAMASSRNYTAAGAKASMSTLSCACCGAPRLGDATTRICEFCGSNF